MSWINKLTKELHWYMLAILLSLFKSIQKSIKFCEKFFRFQKASLCSYNRKKKTLILSAELDIKRPSCNIGYKHLLGNNNGRCRVNFDIKANITQQAMNKIYSRIKAYDWSRYVKAVSIFRQILIPVSTTNWYNDPLLEEYFRLNCLPLDYRDVSIQKGSNEENF